jgi:PKD repeat protein
VKAISAGGSPTNPSKEIAVQLSDQYDQAGCDYTSNVLTGEGKTTTPVSNGYMTGHNSSRISEYAEYYHLWGSSLISGVKMDVCAVRNNSHNPNFAKITIIIRNATDDHIPGGVLYSEDISLDAITTNENVFDFATPVFVPADFFIGFQIYYSQSQRDLFAVYQTPFNNRNNTAYAYYSNQWHELGELLGNTGYKTALYVFPNVCTFIPEPDFEADKTTGYKGSPIQFTNNSLASSETAWLWEFGDGSVSREKNPEHVYTTGGVYTVTLTAENNVGLNESTKEDYITISNEYESIRSIQSEAWKIYPNPAKNYLTVETEQPVQVQIYSITGTLLLQQKINATSVIPINRLQPGVYILKITDANRQMGNYRLVVE